MTSQEMMKSTAGQGYWFVNVAAVDEQPNWQRQVQPLKDDGKLFGYATQEFLRRQYR